MSVVVDARGLACPLPVVRLAAAARAGQPGDRLTVLWTDPAAEHDIPAWARMRGHTVEGTAPWTPPGTDEPGPGQGSDGAAPGAAGPARATTVRLGSPAV